MGYVRPRSLCALLMRSGVGNVAGVSASGSHFSRKATTSVPSIFLTSGRLDRRERFSRSSKLFVRRVTCSASALVLYFPELTVSSTLLMQTSVSSMHTKRSCTSWFHHGFCITNMFEAIPASTASAQSTGLASPVELARLLASELPSSSSIEETFVLFLFFFSSISLR